MEGGTTLAWALFLKTSQLRATAQGRAAGSCCEKMGLQEWQGKEKGCGKQFGCSLLSYFVARAALGRHFRKLLQPGKERFIVLLQCEQAPAGAWPCLPLSIMLGEWSWKAFRSSKKLPESETLPILQNRKVSFPGIEMQFSSLRGPISPPSGQGVDQAQRRVTYNSAFFTGLPKVPWPQGHTVYAWQMK